jgi:DNA (cytosine-5)-methyltransferase 3A
MRFSTITEDWEYQTVGCTMINASLVSAQSRKRLFWVGKWNEEIQWYDWVDIPQPEDRHIYLKDVLLPLSQIDDKYILSDREIKYMNADTTGNYSSRWGNSHYPDNDKSQAMVSNLSKGVPYNVLTDSRGGALRTRDTVDGSHKVLETRQDDKSNCLTSVQSDSVILNTGLKYLGGIGYKDIAGDGKDLSRNVPQGNRVYDANGKSCTLSANGGGLGAKTGLYQINPNAIIRKLHPIETEKLQSLPANYSLIGLEPNKKTGELEEVKISDTQRYKMMGNGFNCEVIKHILTHLPLTEK